MPRKAKRNGSTSLATIPDALPARQATRAQANAVLKARALDLYHAARAERDEHIRAFEAEHGRADRIDHTVRRSRILADLRNMGFWVTANRAAMMCKSARKRHFGALQRNHINCNSYCRFSYCREKYVCGPWALRRFGSFDHRIPASLSGTSGRFIRGSNRPDHSYLLRTAVPNEIKRTRTACDSMAKDEYRRSNGPIDSRFSWSVFAVNSDGDDIFATTLRRLAKENSQEAVRDVVEREEAASSTFLVCYGDPQKASGLYWEVHLDSGLVNYVNDNVNLTVHYHQERVK